MSDMAYKRALDAAHAVGVNRGSWLDVAISAQAFLGVDGACFLCFDKQAQTVATLEEIGHDSSFIRDYEAYAPYDDVVKSNWVANSGTWFSADATMARHGENDRMFWADFMGPHRIAQVSGFVVQNDARFVAALSTQRGSMLQHSYRHQQQIAAYGRALCEAFVQRQRMTESNLDIVNQVLDLEREGYCVVGPAGHVLLASADAGAIFADRSELRIVRNVLTHRDAVWHKRLLGHIKLALVEGKSTLVLPNGWGRYHRLTFKRVDGSLSLGRETAVGIRIERRDISQVPGENVLRELFGLTPAEAKLCHLLVAGLTIHDCAQTLALSVATLRKQLASILQKTCCNRQAELIRLASGF